MLIKQRHLLFFLCFTLGFAGLPAVALDVGATAPDWTLKRADGSEVNYYVDADGQVSMLLFWATWCPFCRALMPYLQQLADEFSDKPVRFYALNIWEDGDAPGYIREHGFTFDLLVQAETAIGPYGVRGTPGLFVVDASRHVVYKRRSGEDDMDVQYAVRETITDALN